jgi:multicomponent K+:H+ antiporter subunit A
MTGLTWAVLRIDLQRHLATYFIEQSKPAGGGANVVNVILVDFRGFDTFSEVAVLSASALIIYALLDGMMHGAWSHKLRQWVPDHHRSPEKHPKLMMIPTRVMLPMALLVAAYIFLRGHNDPGGGFVAGLMVTIALVMQYMVSSYKWADERIHVDAHAWIAMGLLLVTGTSAAAMVMGYPFLTNAHGHLHLPVLGDIGISSAMSFDAGVLMAVVGAMMLTLANLARLGPKAKNTATSGSDLVAKVNPESATEKKRADVPQSQSQPLAIPIQTTASLIGQPNPFLDKDA